MGMSIVFSPALQAPIALSNPTGALALVGGFGGPQGNHGAAPGNGALLLVGAASGLAVSPVYPGAGASSVNGQAPSVSVSVASTLQALWPDPLPNAILGAPYIYTLTASGGVSPYTFAVTSGTLPAGLSLNPATGVVSGTPTATVNMDAVTFSVTDSS
jgi:hypothetical protein